MPRCPHVVGRGSKALAKLCGKGQHMQANSPTLLSACYPDMKAFMRDSALGLTLK